MSQKYFFQEKYRIRSNRMQGYDYRKGWFFVTICTHGMMHFFGEIVGRKVVLNDIGRIVKNEIENISKHRKNVRMDTFVVMPNHIHMIVVINGDVSGGYDRDVLHVSDDRDVLSKRLYVTGNNATDIHINDPIQKRSNTDPKYFSYISPPPHSLGNIIKLFKGFTTKRIQKHTKSKKTIRQPNYYDHIIRNEKSLWTIRTYIHNNPKKREIDRNNIR